MEITVILPDPLSIAADQLAAELNLSRNELYTLALDTFIKSHQPGAITRALNEIYKTESSKLDPIMWQMQLASLPQDDW